jgi:hypothetical protein
MKNKTIHKFLLVLLVALLAGCPKPILKGDGSEAEEPTATEETEKENPRAVASLELTDQGRRLVENKQPDRAIRVLEQAVSLHPANGRNYYYLSEAWILKGFADQAREFNHLAEIHLKDDRHWMIRVAEEADRIAELER